MAEENRRLKDVKGRTVRNKKCVSRRQIDRQEDKQAGEGREII